MDELIRGLSIIKDEAEALQTGSGIYASSDQASRDKKKALLESVKKDFESLQEQIDESKPVEAAKEEIPDIIQEG